ncbi:MAG: heparan-alpha-glucosaminide N-acetyltransferase domain-containing protein [bacterium]
MRIDQLDILRGAAILFMVVANYSPYYIEKPSEILRIMYTFAAPLFVSITGFLMYKNKIEKDYNVNYFVVRGVLLIITASLLEMIGYRIYPLMSVDVLCLIGSCTILLPVLHKVWKYFNLWSILIIFILTIFLQNLFGYNQQAYEITIGTPITLQEYFVITIKQFFIDGYFPIFPWVGIFMLGFAFYDQLYKEIVIKNKMAMIFLFFVFSFILVNTERYIRDGYAELFYPPDFIFQAWATCFLFICFYMINFKNYYVQIIGKSSLFFYIFHCLFVEYILQNINYTKYILNNDFPHINFIISVVITFILMLLISFYFEYLKSKKPNMPFIVKFFIGS